MAAQENVQTRASAHRILDPQKGIAQKEKELPSSNSISRALWACESIFPRLQDATKRSKGAKRRYVPAKLALGQRTPFRLISHMRLSPPLCKKSNKLNSRATTPAQTSCPPYVAPSIFITK